MARLKLFLFLILMSFTANKICTATKLNYPRVLLPIFNKISINFTLEVIEKGCFKWTSSRQDLILITPLYEGIEDECSYRATVTVLSRERRRNTAIVLAEDLATGESLRCDVILDVIDKLGVHTTTRQLYLEEAPETFELRAEDSQGNAFTTLEGVEFNWNISSLGDDNKGWSPALRFLSFSESPYHTVPSALEKFEAENLKGYMVLLEGKNTGAAKVTVSMPYQEYNIVPNIEVYINVMANIILEPSEAHILPGDTINFRILQLKMGKLQEISLNDQYFLEIEDTNIATIRGVSVTGNKLGRTTVVLRDRNVPNDGSFIGDNPITKTSIPSAQLTVAAPVKLGLSLLPHNNWVTVEGEKHEIALDLYTSDYQKITLGSRYSMTSELDEMLFYVFKRSKNGSRVYGEAVKEGVTPVYGSFKELTAQAELQIFSELCLTPTKLILPYDLNVIKTQKIQFNAKGGDNSYVWHSHNPRALQINQNGLATTVIHDATDLKRGHDIYDSGSFLTAHATIKVALLRNQKITRNADVYFIPPVKLEILKYNFETALRDYVRLHVAVYAYVNDTFVPFTRCENLLFDFEFNNQIFQVDYATTTEQMAAGACQVVHLRSTAIGITHLRVSYKFQEKLLKDEVTLSVFEKLSVLNPIENEVVLPIGSSRNVIYSNGPQRIFTLDSELTKSIEYDQKIAEITEMDVDSPNAAMYAFTIMCHRVGKTTFNFNIYNVLPVANFDVYISNIMTTVYCVKPRFLNLYAREKLRSSCPLEMKNSLVHLKERDDKFEIEIEVQDAKNRKLMNISSLFIDWEFAAGDNRYKKNSVMHYRQTEEELFEGIRLPSKDLLITTLTDVAHNIRIKGVVTRYDSTILRKHNISPEEPNFGVKNPKTGEISTPLIENEIRFMAVNTTLFPSDHISLFLAKNRREQIPLAHGSGFYDFELYEQDVVKVEFNQKERELILTPLRIGNARLEVIDRCLMTEPAHLSIAVVSVGAIHVDVPDRVERSKTIEAVVRLYDSNENLIKIDPFNLHIYELSERIFNADILNIKLSDQYDLEVGEIRYTITGNNLGETKIVFTSGSGDNLISSDPVNIQVFPPLRLYPRNSTLVVGSSIQIYYQGGPQPDVNIVYYVHDKKTISMESAIVFARKTGVSKITGQCIMNNPGNGKEVIISEDTVEVHIVPLEHIQIKTPLIRIRSGAVMPAAIWGAPDLSPMVLGTLENMRVIWSANQPDVVDIYSVFTEAGIEYGANDLISVRIKALNPGIAKIHATVELPSGPKLSTTIDVIVFKILELESPKHIKMDWILMAPRSTIQLKSNLDDVVYKPDTDSSGIVRVSPDGIIRTQDTLGRDLIIAKTFEQTLPIGIEVKNVHYILTSIDDSTIKFRQSEEKIPRGMNLMLKVSLHDNLGNEFSHTIEDVNAIKCDLSHKDIVDVQIGNNLTIVLNLLRETSNMIAISLRDTTGVKHSEDYIKLSVAESKHIYPTKTSFTVGDIICFDSSLTLSSIWSSSDEQILSIDRYTGVARVLDSRFKSGDKVTIINGDATSGSFIRNDVEIRSANVIQFLKSYDIFSGSSYRGYLVLRNHLQLDKLTNLVTQNITRCSNVLQQIPATLFKCRLTSQHTLGQQLLDHYKVTPIFETETGRYACQIDLITNFNEILNIIKSNDVHLDLEVTLQNGLTSSMSLKFVPGIRVTPDTLFATDLKDQELTITGLEKVLQKIEVQSSNPSILQVTPQTKTSGTLQYKIKIVNELPLNEQLFINVQSPATLQEIEVPLLGSNALSQKCSQYPFMNTSGFLTKFISYLGLLITAVLILGATVWVYVACNPHRSQPEINTEAFSTSFKEKSRANNISSSDSPKSPTSSYPSPMTPIYPNLSPYYCPRTSTGSPASLSPGNDSPVYGDTTLISPQKRINRRYL